MEYERATLVFSNSTFMAGFLACGFLILMYKLPWYTLLLEQSYITYVIISSGLYHWCDSGPDTDRYCYTDWQRLYNADMIGSYGIIHILFTFSTDASATLYKYVYHALVLIANIVYVLEYKNHDTDNIWYGVIVGLGVISTIVRFLLLRYKYNTIINVMHNEFNYIFGILAFVFGVTGFVFKFTTPNDYSSYWWGHSLWHIFIALSITFAILMRYLPDCMRIGYQREALQKNSDDSVYTDETL